MERMNKITSTQRQLVFGVVVACFALTFFFLWGKVNVYADESAEGYYYSKDGSEYGNGGVILEGYNGDWSNLIDENGTLTLPSTIDGKKVTGLAQNLVNIWSEGLKKVQLPDYLVKDGYGVSAVYDSSYDSEFVEYAISSENNAYTVSDGMLYTKDKKTLVAVPSGKTDITYEKDTTTIGKSAFAYNHSESVELPEAITTIEDEAFEWSRVSEITLPVSLTTLKQEEFGVFSFATNLTSISINGDSENFSVVDGVLYNKDVTTIVGVPAGLTEVTIPETVTTIGEYAFCGTNIEKVEIPNGVISVEKAAFYNATNLSEMSLPSTLESIKEEAFNYCYNLAFVALPERLQSIGNRAFYNSSLSGVYIPESVTDIYDDSQVFEQEASDFKIYTKENSYASTWASKYGFSVSTEAVPEVHSDKYYTYWKESDEDNWSIAFKNWCNVNNNNYLKLPASYKDVKVGKILARDSSWANNGFDSDLAIDIPDTVTSIEENGLALVRTDKKLYIRIPSSVTQISDSIVAEQMPASHVIIVAGEETTAAKWAEEKGYKVTQILPRKFTREDGEEPGDTLSVTKYVDKKPIGQYDNVVALKGKELTLGVQATSTYTDEGEPEIKCQWYDSEGKPLTEEKITNISEIQVTKGSGNEEYICRVSDGNEVEDYHFCLYPERTLTLKSYINSMQKNYLFDAKPEKEYKLRVEATSDYEKDSSKITYEWYVEDEEEEEECEYIPYCDADGKQYTGKNVDIKKSGYGEENYKVVIKDGNDEQEEYFKLKTENTLKVNAAINGESYDSGDTYTVKDTTQPITLSVQAKSILETPLIYIWEKDNITTDEDEDTEWTRIEEAENKTSYKVSMQSDSEKYRCTVTDGVNEERIVFYLEKGIEPTVNITSTTVKVNDTEVKADGDDYYHVKTGDKVELQVEAESLLEGSNLTYEWYIDEEDNPVDAESVSEDGKRCTLTVPKNKEDIYYCCKVTNEEDGYSIDEEFYLINDSFKSDITKFDCYIGKEIASSLDLESFDTFNPVTLSIKPSTEGVKSEDFEYKWIFRTQDEDEVENEDTVLSDENSLEITPEFIKQNNLNKKTYFGVKVRATNKTNADDTNTYLFWIRKANYTEDIYPYIGEENTDGASVVKGAEVTLKVVPTEDNSKKNELTYQWCDSDYNAISSANTSEYTVTKGKGTEKFYCIVSYGNDSTSYAFTLFEVDKESCKHQLKKVGAKASTCTKAGNKEYWICENCSTMFDDADGRNETTVKAVTLPLADHTVVVDPAVAPTETTPGKTEGEHCSVCNKVLVAQKVIPATGKQPSGNDKPSTGNTTPKPQQPTQPASLQKGTKVTDKKSKAVYKVNGNKTVEYNKVDKKAKKATVPSTITVNGVKYQVTSIAAKAFANNKKLTKVVIPSSVRSIGKQAFSGCKNLKSIMIKTTYLTKKSVGAKAFKGIHAKATIKVPKKQKKAYQKFLKTKGIGKGVKIK